jgi:hypothetical protein
MVGRKTMIYIRIKREREKHNTKLLANRCTLIEQSGLFRVEELGCFARLSKTPISGL